MFSHCLRATHISRNPPQASTMASTSKRPSGHDDVVSTLAAHIQTLNLAKDHAHGISPAQAAFSSVSALLDKTMVDFPYSAMNLRLTPV
jgi:hypothetical protein